MTRRTVITMICCAILVVRCGMPLYAAEPAGTDQRKQEEKAAEQKLTELDKNMQQLNAEAARKEDPPRSEINKLYDEFRKQQGVAKKELEELRSSTNEAWYKAKKDMDRAIENLNGLYERSKARSTEGGEKK